MRDAALRRVGWVLGAYAVAAWPVWKVAHWFATALALPELFRTLLLVGVIGGVPVAALVAWHYPDIGKS